MTFVLPYFLRGIDSLLTRLRHSPAIAVLAIYFLLAAVVTYPFVFSPRDTLTAPLYGDVSKSVIMYSAYVREHANPFTATRLMSIAQPDGIPNNPGVNRVCFLSVTYLLLASYAIGPIIAHSVEAFLGYLLTAFVMFLFVRAVTKSAAAGFIAGLVYRASGRTCWASVEPMGHMHVVICCPYGLSGANQTLHPQASSPGDGVYRARHILDALLCLPHLPGRNEQFAHRILVHQATDRHEEDPADDGIHCRCLDCHLRRILCDWHHWHTRRRACASADRRIQSVGAPTHVHSARCDGELGQRPERAVCVARSKGAIHRPICWSERGDAERYLAFTKHSNSVARSAKPPMLQS